MLSNWLFIYYLGTLVLAVQSQFISGNVETIPGGKYIYYNFTAADYYVYVQLTSIKGDCDVYISETSAFPTFDDYTLHSATCGLDTVLVPKRLKRPIHIGLYGHPSFDENECQLSLCLLDDGAQDEFRDEVTELAEISKLTVHCVAETTNSISALRRGLVVLSDLIMTIEFDTVLLEIIGTFAQTVI